MHHLGAKQGATGTRSSLGHTSSGVSLPGGGCREALTALHRLCAVPGDPSALGWADGAGPSSARRQRTVSTRAETKPLSPLEVLKRENELLKQVRWSIFQRGARSPPAMRAAVRRVRAWVA